MIRKRSRDFVAISHQFLFTSSTSISQSNKEGDDENSSRYDMSFDLILLARIEQFENRFRSVPNTFILVVESLGDRT